MNPRYDSASDLVREIADLLRGRYSAADYERVILPMTLLRRLDCVLASTKAGVLREYDRAAGGDFSRDALEARISKITQQRFHNNSPYDFRVLTADPQELSRNLGRYINGFSTNIREIFHSFEFEEEIRRMDRSNILYLIFSRFSQLDLRPEKVSDDEMGRFYDELITCCNELAHEVTGDHFTPRDVIRLMVSLLFRGHDQLLETADGVRTLLDPACGSGGMLAQAWRYVHDAHAVGRLHVYGQDFNRHAFATAAADQLMKDGSSQQDRTDNIRFGDIFTDDRFQDETFDYFLCSPPFGVDWRMQKHAVTDEYESLGPVGRFGAGLPRINDSSFLFLQHMWSKRRKAGKSALEGGSRLAITFSASPMFVGGAGSGESEIRRWLIENDWLEAIIALPEQMFYNTGIGAYVWLLSNHKEPRRAGKVQLIDSRDAWAAGVDESNRRGLGSKRRHIGDNQIAEVIRIYESFEDGHRSKIISNSELGYTRIAIEYPLRLRYQMTLDRKARFLNAYPDLLDDIQAIDTTLGREPLLDWTSARRQVDDILSSRRSHWKARERQIFESVFTDADPAGRPVVNEKSEYGIAPDLELREFENIPLGDAPDEFFRREIAPYSPDAWLDRSRDRIGFEINFNQYFRTFTPPRSLADIDTDLKRIEEDVIRLWREATS